MGKCVLQTKGTKSLSLQCVRGMSCDCVCVCVYVHVCACLAVHVLSIRVGKDWKCKLLFIVGECALVSSHTWGGKVGKAVRLLQVPSTMHKAKRPNFSF